MLRPTSDHSRTSACARRQREAKQAEKKSNYAPVAGSIAIVHTNTLHRLHSLFVNLLPLLGDSHKVAIVERGVLPPQERNHNSDMMKYIAHSPSHTTCVTACGAKILFYLVQSFLEPTLLWRIAKFTLRIV